MDRFTAVLTGRHKHLNGGQFFYRGMSENPFHPQGYGMSGASDRPLDTAGGSWGGPPIGKSNQLGKRIAFEDAPAAVRECILQDLTAFFPKRKDYADMLTKLQKAKKAASRLPIYGKKSKT